MIIKSIEELKKSINNKKLGNFVVIHGNKKDEIKISEDIIKNIVVNFRELNIIEIGGNNINIDNIKNACETVPMIDTNKVVYIKTPSFLTESVDIIGKNLLKEILEYSKDIPEYTILLIIHSDIIEKSNPILKLASNIGTLVEYKIPSYGRELTLWIEEFLKLHGKNINKSEAFYLSSELSTSIDFLEGELQKLISYVGEKDYIEKSDIDMIVYKTPESNIFKMADYMFNKNAKGAIEILDTLVLQGEQYSKILFMIIRQFRIFYAIKIMLTEGINQKEIMKELKIQDFAYRKMEKVLSKWEEKKIKLVLEDALNTDYNIKSGQITPDMALELLILKTCK